MREMCVCGMCACVDGKGKVGAVHNARSPSVFPFLVVVWHGGFVGFSLCRVSRFDLWRCHCQCSFHRMWFALLSFSLACAFFPFSLLAPTPFFLTPAPKANSQHEVSAMCAAVVCSVVVCFVACSLYHHGLCRVRCCVHPPFPPVFVCLVGLTIIIMWLAHTFCSRLSRLELCSFSGYKIHPGRGRTLVKSDGVFFAGVGGVLLRKCVCVCSQHACPFSPHLRNIALYSTHLPFSLSLCLFASLSRCLSPPPLPVPQARPSSSLAPRLSPSSTSARTPARSRGP